MHTQTTAQYFEAFFEEKELPLHEYFEVQGPSGLANSISYGIVVDAIKLTKGAEAAKIADTLRRIDFANGDVCHYLRHLAQGMAI